MFSLFWIFSNHLNIFSVCGENLEKGGIMLIKLIEVICGNCDDPAQYPCNGKILELAGHRIMVIHGHVLFDSETDVDTAIKKVAESAKRNHCDIAFFGHLHIYCDVFVDGIRVCNPGSIWHNRDGFTPSYMSVQISECVVNITKETYAPY